MRVFKLWSIFAGRVHSNFSSQAFCARTRGASALLHRSSCIVYRSWASVHGSHGLPFGPVLFFLTKFGRDRVLTSCVDADLTLPCILYSYDGLTHSTLTPTPTPSTSTLTLTLIIHTHFNPRQKNQTTQPPNLRNKQRPSRRDIHSRTSVSRSRT